MDETGKIEPAESASADFFSATGELLVATTRCIWEILRNANPAVPDGLDIEVHWDAHARRGRPPARNFDLLIGARLGRQWHTAERRPRVVGTGYSAGLDRPGPGAFRCYRRGPAAPESNEPLLCSRCWRRVREVD